MMKKIMGSVGMILIVFSILAGDANFIEVPRQFAHELELLAELHVRLKKLNKKINRGDTHLISKFEDLRKKFDNLSEKIFRKLRAEIKTHSVKLLYMVRKIKKLGANRSRKAHAYHFVLNDITETLRRAIMDKARKGEYPSEEIKIMLKNLHTICDVKKVVQGILGRPTVGCDYLYRKYKKLAKEAGNKHEKANYIRLAIRYANTIPQVIDIYKETLENKLLIEGIDVARNVEEVIELAKGAPTHTGKDSILLRGIKVATDIKDIIKLGNNTVLYSTEDRIYYKSIPFCKSIDDVVELSWEAETYLMKDKISKIGRELLLSTSN